MFWAFFFPSLKRMGKKSRKCTVQLGLQLGNGVGFATFAVQRSVITHRGLHIDLKRREETKKKKKKSDGKFSNSLFVLSRHIFSK